MRHIVLGAMDWRAGLFGGWSGAFDPDDAVAGPRRGFFRSGEVRLALLSLLADGPAHGYDLMKRLEARAGRTYHASAVTVYPVLQQLEDEDLASARTVDGKKVYALTAAGRQELSKSREQIDAIWQRAERWHEMGSQLTPAAAGLAMVLGQLGMAALRAAKEQPELLERIRAILVRAVEGVRAAAGGPQGGKGKSA